MQLPNICMNFISIFFIKSNEEEILDCHLMNFFPYLRRRPLGSHLMVFFGNQGKA
jgi:hypothetical protein